MKKLLCVILSLTMLFGLTFGASAATIASGVRGVNVADYARGIAQNKITLNDKTAVSLSGLTGFEPNPGDVVKIPLTANLFLDRNKKTLGTALDSVSLSALKAAGISVLTSTSAGAGVASITLDGNKSGSYIKIEFSKSPEHTGKKFAYSVFLSHNGTRRSATRIGVSGTLSANEIEIGPEDFAADLAGGATAKANATIRGFEFFIGDYCSIIRTVIKGKKYQGVALTDILPQDEELFWTYPGLEHIYRLKTSGLKTAGNCVRFDMDETYYVYNTNGDYLGTTARDLPYWTKYYLSSKKYAKLSVTR